VESGKPAFKPLNQIQSFKLFFIFTANTAEVWSSLS